MSWLLFHRAGKHLQLFAGSRIGALGSVPLGSWPAHNDTALTSKGAWQNGTLKWSGYNPHSDQPGFGPSCFRTAFGCWGTQVFSVPNRTGMGVHSGRVSYAAYPTGVGGKTLGCIRTSEDAMAKINTAHNRDPLVGIKVAD